MYDKSHQEYELHTRIIKMRSKYEPNITITIDGNSMLPSISHGDKVTFETNSIDYEVGDIVVFIMNGVMLVHRIIGKRREYDTVYYTIRGDNAPGYDGEYFTKDDILGTVVGIQKKS